MFSKRWILACYEIKTESTYYNKQSRQENSSGIVFGDFFFFSFPPQETLKCVEVVEACTAVCVSRPVKLRAFQQGYMVYLLVR